MRSLTLAFAGTVLVTGALAQSPTKLGETASQLLEPHRAPSALHDLRAAGESGARAVYDAYRSSSGEDRAAFARALAAFGPATHALVAELVDEIPRRDEPLRSLLLRALATGALLADKHERVQIQGALQTWAGDGLLYSPSAEQPTYAWYEYVRAVRRLRLAALPCDANGLEAGMTVLRRDRGSTFVPFLRNQQKPKQAKDPFAHCAIESYGAHGQREMLEGIAEQALRCDAPPAQLVSELAGYLRYSPPRPPRVRTEHCAGIGESAPNQMPAVRFPTRWRYDHWHFPVAQAVLAHSKVDSERELALRHLLHADVDATRLPAIERLRMWPRPWRPFLADLATGLQSPSRCIRRATVVTLGMAGALPADVRAPLQRLAEGDDAELRALAKRALR